MTDLPHRQTKPRAHPEEDLQRAIWQHYLIRGNPLAILYAVPNGSPRSKRTGAVLPDGRAAFLEIKILGGRLSPEQKAFGARLDKIGVEHCVCYDLDTALSVLSAWGVIKESM